MKRLKPWLQIIIDNNDCDREVDLTITDDKKETRRGMFDKYEAELRSRKLSNSQQYDKAYPYTLHYHLLGLLYQLRHFKL